MKIPAVECAKHTWWQNFYNQDSGYCELDILQIALAQYNCRYINCLHTSTGSYIEFDSNEDYVMFVLRWA